MRQLAMADGAIRRLLVLILPAAFMFAEPAAARDLTEDERTSLQLRVDAYAKATRALDYDAIFAVLPPGVIPTIAEMANIEESVLRVEMVTQMQGLMDIARMLSFGMDVAAAPGGTLPDGTPYAIIPTVTVMEVEGIKATGSTPTVAIFEDGAWYLMRIDDEQREILLLLYPDFATIDIPPSTLELVE